MMGIITLLPLPFISQRMGHAVDGLNKEQEILAVERFMGVDVTRGRNSEENTFYNASSRVLRVNLCF